jgi:hypothetical protein
MKPGWRSSENHCDRQASWLRQKGRSLRTETTRLVAHRAKQRPAMNQTQATTGGHLTVDRSFSAIPLSLEATSSPAEKRDFSGRVLRGYYAGSTVLQATCSEKSVI